MGDCFSVHCRKQLDLPRGDFRLSRYVYKSVCNIRVFSPHASKYHVYQVWVMVCESVLSPFARLVDLLAFTNNDFSSDLTFRRHFERQKGIVYFNYFKNSLHKLKRVRFGHDYTCLLTINLP